MDYTYECRDCGAVWEASHSIHTQLDECLHCESLSIFRHIEKTGMQLKHNPGDVCGWANSGYTRDKIIDLGKDTGSKAARWANVKN